MMAKLAGLAWMLTFAAGCLLAGCQEPGKSVPGATSMAAPEPADPVVRVAGFNVRSAQFDQVLKLFKGGRDYGSFDRTMPAIEVMLHVATRKYDLINLQRVIVESLTDETGRDLSLGMTQATGRLFFPADTNISRDHKHGFVSLHFPTSPAPNTRRMTMRGTVLARSGGKPQTLTFENVPFAVGSKFNVLGKDYTLRETWTYDSRPDQLHFSFTTDGSYDDVRAIRFLSTDGKKVVGTISRVDRGMREPTKLLCAVEGEKPQAMRIEVDTFEQPVDLAIPFQLNLDLGVLGSADSAKLVTTATLPAAPTRDKIRSQAQVVALSMTEPITDQQAREWFGERASVSQFQQAGLSMQVKVHVPDRTMVRMVSGPGSALSFVDDTGASLLAAASVSANVDRGGMRDQTPISRDGHDALITVSAGKLPAPGARELRFNGKFGVVMAEAEKTNAATGVALLPGSTFKVGDVEMTVALVRAAGPAGNGMYLVLKADKAIAGTVTLLDENGKPLAASVAGADPARSHYLDTHQFSFTLAKVVESATVQVKTTQESDAVPVPVEFVVPLGLGSQP